MLLVDLVLNLLLLSVGAASLAFGIRYLHIQRHVSSVSQPPEPPAEPIEEPVETIVTISKKIVGDQK